MPSYLNAATWLALCLSVCASGCGRETSSGVGNADGEAATPVIIQLNWHAETEHGGAYAALASGAYERRGVDVQIRPGGPATPVAADLASGRCQFAFANADDVALYRQQGVEVVAVLAAMQDHPRCILVRTDSGITDLEDLDGLILQRQPGRPFLEFMRRRGLLDGVQEVPYTGSVAALVTSENVAIQAYSFAEPLLAQQQGVEVTPLMVNQLGWNPYSSVLVTTESLIDEQPDLVRAVVQATREGWREYLESPESANRLILAANHQGMTAEALQYGALQMRQLALPAGAEADVLGRMTQQRWETLVAQLAELGLVDPEVVQAADCFDTSFIDASDAGEI